MLPIGLDPCRSLEIFTFLNGNQSYGNSVVSRLSCRWGLRVFTKVMKLLIGKIRSQGIRSVIDLDDMAVSETVSADPVSGLHN